MRRWVLKGDLQITIISPAFRENPVCPSRVKKTSSPGAVRTTSIITSSGSTIGLLVNVWEQMGVRSILPSVGYTIGPPAEREYAVEPVGVEIISPSAFNVAT